MIPWLAENLASLVLTLVVIAIVFLLVQSRLKHRRRGNCGCGCGGCRGCAARPGGVRADGKDAAADCSAAAPSDK